MNSSLSGHVVAITGGARGIGLAIAHRLIANGARVAVGDVDQVALEGIAAGSGPLPLLLDVTNERSFARFLDQVEEQLGPIDALVNNAGIMPVGRIADEPDAVTRRMLDINLYGVILGSKLATQRMAPRGRGQVVNIASMAGEVPVPGLATYCATKAAVLAFTDAARLEHRATGVTFSAVLPSFTNTELTAGTQGTKGFRNAEPEEVAEAVLSLLRRPRPRVRRTRAMGALVQAQRFLPRAVNESVARRLGAESVFLDGVDPAARALYEARARGTGDRGRSIVDRSC